MSSGAREGKKGNFKTKVLRHAESVEETISFVQQELPVWRDDPDRKPAPNEDALNEGLCHHLSANAIGLNMMVRFHHQPRQANRRSSDISAHANKKQIWAEGYSSTIYDPILLIEGKRLPTPGSGREHEYVTGFSESTGGIQRFKQAVHGAANDRAVIIGYLEKHDASHWRAEINRWINEIVKNKSDISCAWRADEILGDFSKTSQRKAYRCESSHRRMNNLKPIRLIHLWIDLVQATSNKVA